MILSAHIIAGSLIGKYVKRSWQVVLLSIIIHLAMDAIPHWEYKIRSISTAREWKKILFDISAGFAIGFLIVRQINANIILGIFFSVIIDGFEFAYIKWKLKIAKPVARLHHWVHCKKVKN